MVTSEAPVARIAMFSLHTSPFDQPGVGASGGMNVEIRTLVRLLGARGVAADVFTRCAGRSVPQMEQAGPLTRIIQVQAGPCAEVAIDKLPSLVPEFTAGVSGLEAGLGSYDLVHSHYWLSGEAALGASRSWGLPLVTSLHTLAEVKNLALAPGDPPEPLARVAGERRTIRAADRVVVPTREDANHLLELYSAEAGRIRVVPPGVDAERFRPRDRHEARRRFGLGSGPVILLVGRLQRLKGPDLAVEAFARAVRRAPRVMRDSTLLIVGGPSGRERDSILPWLEGIAAAEGVSGRVRLIPPRAHDEMPWVYSAADALVMPSRSESFGLAALEAQACGTPVIASKVGGLTHAVRDGGFLIEGRDPSDYADRILRIISSPELAEKLSRGAICHAATYPWERSVDGLLSVYGELIPDLESARAS